MRQRYAQADARLFGVRERSTLPNNVQRPSVVAAGLLLVSLPTVALAMPSGGCDPGGTPALGQVQITAPVGTFYLDDRGVGAGGEWIYQESNGIPGLQPGGSSAYVPGDTDSCSRLWPPDTLILGTG